MKNLLTVLIVLLISTSSYAQIQEIQIEDQYIVYKTAKEGEVEVSFTLRDTDPSEVVMDDLLKMLQYTNSVTQSVLKSRRSFVPLSYSYKFKKNKKGKASKNKHSVWITYEATNSYGAATEGFQQIEFNAKLKETAGSVMLRMN